MITRETLGMYFRITAWLRRRILHIISKGSSGISLTNSESPIGLRFNFSTEIQNGLIFSEVNPRTNIPNSHYFKPRHLIRAKDVIIDSQTGIVFTNSGEFITESSFWPELWLKNNVIPKPVAPTSIKFDNNYVLMPSNGFYHCLIEDIPMVVRQILENRFSKLLIYESAPSYVLDFVQLIGHDVVRIPRYVFLPNYCFLQRNSDVGWPHPKDVEILRSFFLKSQNRADHRHPRNAKLYVSRLNSTRSPRFEARLTEELVKRGWKIILSENLNMSEQIELFSGASWIAGVHGAGLSSMVWMNEGSRVTELGPARFVPCYSRLATILSHDYQRVEFTDSDKALENILSILN